MRSRRDNRSFAEALYGLAVVLVVACGTVSSVSAYDGSGRTDVRQLSLGRHHSCVLFEALRQMKCFGRNLEGQLGYGDTSEVNDLCSADNTYIDVGDTQADVESICTGWFFTCALFSANGTQGELSTFKCWGDNTYGQLGYGDTNGVLSPADVGFVDLADSANDTAVQIVCGHYHVCVRFAGGGLKCWGDNGSGQLGYGDKTQRREPDNNFIDVGTSDEVIDVKAGRDFTCAVFASNGELKCWGSGTYGRLGTGGTATVTSPSDVDYIGSPSGVISLTLGNGHACAIARDGGSSTSTAVWCWGYNHQGQVGDGTLKNALSPIKVLEVDGLVDVSALQYHSCASVQQINGSHIHCWGDNARGQLGDGTTADQRSAAQSVATSLEVDGSPVAVQSVNVGHQHSCSLTVVSHADHYVHCWGLNNQGQLGYPSIGSLLQPSSLPLCLVKPSSTPSPTPTSSPSLTSTPSSTATPTSTPTATATATASATPTATSTSAAASASSSTGALPPTTSSAPAAASIAASASSSASASALSSTGALPPTTSSAPAAASIAASASSSASASASSSTGVLPSATSSTPAVASIAASASASSSTDSVPSATSSAPAVASIAASASASSSTDSVPSATSVVPSVASIAASASSPAVASASSSTDSLPFATSTAAAMSTSPLSMTATARSTTSSSATMTATARASSNVVGESAGQAQSDKIGTDAAALSTSLLVLALAAGCGIFVVFRKRRREERDNCPEETAADPQSSARDGSGAQPNPSPKRDGIAIDVN